MKKNNRRCQYCGMDNSIPLLRLRLLIRSKVYHRCKYCGRVSCYIQVSHIVHDTTDKLEKDENKLLEENKRRLWMR